MEQKGKRIVVIEVGSDEIQKICQRYAYDEPISLVKTSMTSITDLFWKSNAIRKYYKILTGEELDWKKKYDIQVTLDSSHKNDLYSSYIWINSNGELMEKNKIYPNDKVTIGRLSGFLLGKYTPLLEISLDRSVKATDYYQEMLIPALVEDFNVKVK